MKDKKSSNFSSTYRQVGPYLGLGTQLAFTIVLMFFIGKWIDEAAETSPVFIIIFTFAGAIAGLYNFIKTVLTLNNKKKNDKNS